MNIETAKNLQEVENYNSLYYKGAFAGSEATPVSIEIAKMLFDLRDTKGYTWTNELTNGNWQRYDLCPGSHKKYGCNYVYIDHERKLMRTRQTASEFYNH